MMKAPKRITELREMAGPLVMAMAQPATAMAQPAVTEMAQPAMAMAQVAMAMAYRAMEITRDPREMETMGTLGTMAMPTAHRVMGVMVIVPLGRALDSISRNPLSKEVSTEAQVCIYVEEDEV